MTKQPRYRTTPPDEPFRVVEHGYEFCHEVLCGKCGARWFVWTGTHERATKETLDAMADAPWRGHECELPEEPTQLGELNGWRLSRRDCGTVEAERDGVFVSVEPRDTTGGASLSLFNDEDWLNAPASVVAEVLRLASESNGGEV